MCRVLLVAKILSYPCCSSLWHLNLSHHRKTHVFFTCDNVHYWRSELICYANRDTMCEKFSILFFPHQLRIVDGLRQSKFKTLFFANAIAMMSSIYLSRICRIVTAKIEIFFAFSFVELFISSFESKITTQSLDCTEIRQKSVISTQTRSRCNNFIKNIYERIEKKGSAIVWWKTFSRLLLQSCAYPSEHAVQVQFASK